VWLGSAGGRFRCNPYDALRRHIGQDHVRSCYKILRYFLYEPFFPWCFAQGRDGDAIMLNLQQYHTVKW
jgi:hypothetical protein